MKRFLAPTCVAFLALGPGRAADPKPVWEVGTGAAERRSFQVNWVGFSSDDKQVIARFDSGAERGRKEERLAAWDADTRKQRFDTHLGDGTRPRRVVPQPRRPGRARSCWPAGAPWGSGRRTRVARSGCPTGR
jgi:hypothetical protein